MGHSTARVAMIYLHGTDERQQAIADSLSKLAERSQRRSRPNRSGIAAGTEAPEGFVKIDHLRAN